MTDFEKVYELLKQLGVEFAVTSTKRRSGKSIEISDAYYKLDYDECEIVNEGCGKVECYSGFHTYYSFDENGKFELIGIYE
jgi:hypothetical protein